MLTQPFLRRLIGEANQLWMIAPAAIYAQRMTRAVEARTAVFVVAYEHECTPRELRNAFGWSDIRNGYHPGEVSLRHMEWLANEAYRTRQERLTVYADSLLERAAA